MVLGSVEVLRKVCTQARVIADLAALWASLDFTCRRTERLWFLLGYLDLPRLTPAARRLVRKLLRLAQASRTRKPQQPLPKLSCADPGPRLADESSAAAGRVAE